MLVSYCECSGLVDIYGLLYVRLKVGIFCEVQLRQKTSKMWKKMPGTMGNPKLLRLLLESIRDPKRLKLAHLNRHLPKKRNRKAAL